MTTDPSPSSLLVLRALQALAFLLEQDRLSVSWVYVPNRGGMELLSADTTDRPEARGALLAGLSDLAEPEDWHGEGGTYRDWVGTLLTMRVAVTTRTFGIHGPVYSSAPEPEKLETSFSASAPVPAPAPEAPPAAAPETDHKPLLALLLDERYGPATPPIVEVEGAPGESTDALRLKYAGIPGVVVVPGRPDTPEISEEWRGYARARALREFHGHTFPSLAEALTAVNLWPGRDMLEPADAVSVAEQLVDPSASEADRDRAGAAGARGRLRSLIPAQLRRRAAGPGVSL